MTTLLALKNSVNYPLEDSHVEPLLIKRGVDASADFTTDVANSKEYELAYADVLRFVVTMVNLSQGGSVTQASVRSLAGTANAIYRKYGESVIGDVADTETTVTFYSI